MKILTSSSLKPFLNISPICSVNISVPEAQHDAGDYENLLNEACSKGFARVLITLDETVSLEDMTSRQVPLSIAMENSSKYSC